MFLHLISILICVLSEVILILLIYLIVLAALVLHLCMSMMHKSLDQNFFVFCFEFSISDRARYPSSALVNFKKDA